MDLCLKFQKEDSYNYVVNRLKGTENERASFVAEFVKPVELTAVLEAGIGAVFKHLNNKIIIEIDEPEFSSD